MPKTLTHTSRANYRAYVLAETPQGTVLYYAWEDQKNGDKTVLQRSGCVSAEYFSKNWR